MAPKSTPKNKAPGPDHITTDMTKTGRTILKIIQEIFNSCLKEKKIPHDWNNANTILIYKIGDRTDPKNYSQISRLSHLYKSFIKIMTSRLQYKLEKIKDREQARFRKGFSTTDHIQTLNQILKKTQEVTLPLCMAFIGYEMAFDALEKPAIIEALENQHTEKQYIDLIKYLYNNATTSINLHNTKIDIKQNREIRLKDMLSPILFITCLDYIVRRLS